MSRRLLAVGLLALLPGLGGDDAAVEAVREGNALYRAHAYEAALEKYAAAAERMPDTPEIAFNAGNAWFRKRDYERAVEHYMSALAADDPGLESRAVYNIGVTRLRQALATKESLSEAVALTESAIRSFRDSLDLDRNLSDARHNLELAYRFLGQLEQKLMENQRNDPTPGDKTSLRRGQALRDRIRNEGGGNRRAMPDLDRQTHGERGNEAPENFSANEQQEQPKDARLPIAMSPEAAAELMERLLEEIEAAEAWRDGKRRAALQAPGEREPW